MSMDNEQGGVAMSDVAEIALINRIEAAGAEEQRGLLEEAAVQLWGEHFRDVVIHDPDDFDKFSRFEDLLDAEAYVDAALMLVPDGVDWQYSSVTGTAYVGNFDTGARFFGNTTAATPALAIAAASLRAGGGE